MWVWVLLVCAVGVCDSGQVLELPQRRQVMGPVETVAYIHLAPESITLVTSVTANASLNSAHSVEIRVLDVESGLEMEPMKFPGRVTSGNGRYQIGGLSPGHWYGLVYRDTVTLPYEYFHSDHRILRTFDSADTQNPPLYAIKAYRMQNDQIFMGVEAVEYKDLETFEIMFQTMVTCDNGKHMSRSFRLNSTSALLPTVGMFFPRFIWDSSTESQSELGICYRACVAVWLNATKTDFQILFDQTCINLDEDLPMLELQKIQSLIVTSSAAAVVTRVPLSWQEDPWNVSIPNSRIMLTATPLNASACDGAETRRQILSPGLSRYSLERLRGDCWYRLAWEFRLSEPALRLGDAQLRLFRTPPNASDASSLDPQLLLFDSRRVDDKLRVDVTRSADLPEYDVDVVIHPFCGEGEQRMYLPSTRPVQTLEIETTRLRRRRTNQIKGRFIGDCERLCWNYELSKANEHNADKMVLETRCQEMEGVFYDYAGLIQKSHSSHCVISLPFVIAIYFAFVSCN